MLEIDKRAEYTVNQSLTVNVITSQYMNLLKKV